jgi:hypothetical protein
MLAAVRVVNLATLRIVVCSLAAAAVMSPGQPARNKAGKFTKKSKLRWLENVIVANKRRKGVARRESKCGFTDSVRRVVELDVLAEELWCNFCSEPLSLRNASSPSMSGLAALMQVRCMKCLAVFDVHTCKTKDCSPGRPSFEVNKKAAICEYPSHECNITWMKRIFSTIFCFALIAMLDAGLGPSRLNTFLSGMNIPTMSENLLKRSERCVGVVVEQLAQESCLKSLRIEKALTK